MPIDISMPKLGLTMDEGTVVRWRAAEGEHVVQGEPLLEVETDKVVVEVEAPASGVMGPLRVHAGEKTPVGALLARLYAVGELTDVLAEAAPAAPREIARPALSLSQDLGRPDTTRSGGLGYGGGRTTSSPRARWRARGLGLDWRVLPGSGPRGRVIERDVLAAAERRAAEPPGLAATAGPASLPTVRWETPTTVQRIATERMTASVGSAPHLYLSVEIVAEALLELRARLLPVVAQRAGVELTVTDVLVRICGAALAATPHANAFWDDGHIGIHAQINVGIATTTDAGLIVPVLRDADRKPLSQIASERVELVEKVRRGMLAADDLAGGAFALANLEMFRVDTFHAIVNPPQSAILAVGRIAERPIAIGGQLTVRRTVVLTLSCDHRVFDGALAAQLLGRVADLIEEPYGLLI